MSTALRIGAPEPEPPRANVRPAPVFEPIAPRRWVADRVDEPCRPHGLASVHPMNRMLPDEDELRAFLRTLLEVVGGQRPAGQLAHRFAPALTRKLRLLAITRRFEHPRQLSHHWLRVGSDNASMEVWGTAVRLDCPAARFEAFAGRVETHGLSWWCTDFGILTSARSTS